MRYINLNDKGNTIFNVDSIQVLPEPTEKNYRKGELIMYLEKSGRRMFKYTNSLDMKRDYNNIVRMIMLYRNTDK